MRRFTELNILLALTLLSVSTAAQKPTQTPVSKPQLPSQAVTEYQIKAALSMEVAPNPATVNRPARIRAIQTPDTGVWEFEFYMNSSRLTECAISSPVCDWTPKVSGEHSLIVLARFGVPSRGGGGGGGGRGGGSGQGTQTVRAVLSFGVDPEPIATPTPTPTPTPPPQLDIRLLSDIVIAQRPARFEVSLTNATTAEYLIKFGDGDFEPRTGTVVDHTFEKEGLVTIVVRYAGVSPPLEQSLTVNVEPRPQPAPSTTPGTSVDTRRDEGPPPPPPPPPLVWPYVLAGAVIVGAWIVARAIRPNKNTSLPPPVPTFHPHLQFVPRFEPRRTGGVSLVVIYLRNLDSLRFSSRKTIGSED